MRGRTHEHKGAAHHPRHRRRGGGIMEAGGNPNVLKEGHEKDDGEVSERKHGGKAKHHAKHRKDGGHVDGQKPKHHMGKHAPRHHRKSGGRIKVGADTSPLTTANHASKDPGKQPKTQEGGMSE